MTLHVIKTKQNERGGDPGCLQMNSVPLMEGETPKSQIQNE